MTNGVASIHEGKVDIYFENFRLNSFEFLNAPHFPYIMVFT